MDCPICKKGLVDYDDRALRQVGSFFVKFITPLSALKSMIVGMYNVGKTIYYDFSDIPQTEEYLYCTRCKVYFISCCHCEHLNCIGSNIMVSPKRITCSNCCKDYVYATHPNPEVDHGI